MPVTRELQRIFRSISGRRSQYHTREEATSSTDAEPNTRSPHAVLSCSELVRVLDFDPLVQRDAWETFVVLLDKVDGEYGACELVCRPPLAGRLYLLALITATGEPCWSIQIYMHS